MLVIRDSQMAALVRDARESFESRLARDLSETFPDRFPSAAAPATVQFADRAIQAALLHGIATEHSVARLATLRAAFGEQFEWTPVAPQALALLANPALPDPIKVAAIEDCLYASTGGRAITVVPGQGL